MRRGLGLVLALAGILGSLAAMPVNAQFNAGNGWGGQTSETQCPPGRELAAITAVISASEIDACMTLPSFVHSNNIDSNGATTGYATVAGVINVGGPDIVAAGVAAFSIATSGFSGCNYNSEDTVSDILAAGTGAAIFFNLDITGVYCSGRITLTVTAAATPVTLARFRFVVNIRSEQILPTQFDNLNRFCDHSTWGASCDKATMGVDISSWPSLGISSWPNLGISSWPGLDIRSWPSLQTDTQSKRSGAIQMEANGPLIEAPQAGSVTIPLLLNALAPPTLTTGTALSLAPLVDSVVGGNGVCTVSSTVTATDSGTLTDGSKMFSYRRAVTFDADYCHISGTATLSTTGAPAGAVRFYWIISRNSEQLVGIPDTQQEIQAIADAIAAGIDITICPESAPCYQVLSGHIDTDTNTTLVGNSTTIIPADLNLHFPANDDTPGMDRMGWLVFWIVLIAAFGRLSWWFALASAIPGFLDALLPDLFNDYQDLTPELFLTVCLLGFCLEAAASRFSWGYYKGRPRGNVNGA